MTLHDAQKFAADEVAKRQTLRDKSATFKSTLDSQVAELQLARDAAKAERQREIEEELSAQAEAKRLAAEAEVERVKLKLEAQRSYSAGLSEAVAEKRKLQEEERVADQLMLTQTREGERSWRETMRQTRSLVRADRKKLALDQLVASRELRRERRDAERRFDRQLAAAQEAKAQEAPHSHDPASLIAARRARVDHIMDTMGAEVAERLARQARESEERGLREHLEGLRRSEEEHTQRLAAHRDRVKEMLDVRQKQLGEGKPDIAREREADRKQAEIWRQQRQESEEQERERLAKARHLREEMDATLRQQMGTTAGLHPSELGVTKQMKQREIQYNRNRFEQMLSEGFRPDLTATLLWQAQV